MNKMSFGNKSRNENTLQTLSQALANRDKRPINIGNVAVPQGGRSSSDNISGGMQEAMSGALKLGKGLQSSGLFGGSGAESSGIFGNAANNFITDTPDYGIFGNAANSSIMGGGESAGIFGDAANSSIAGGGSSGGGFGSGVPWGMIANTAKGIYNNISGHSPEEYSDLEQSTIYPLQGAANGAAFGPWGALGGALYGLGYSFKDDLGLKDSNFFSQLLHPIGMGDGGGLRIGGEPILDIL